MRFLDIAAAALVGVVSISLISYMDPLPFNSASEEYSQEAALRAFLLKVVDREGLPVLRSATPEEVCSSIEAFSNETVAVSAVAAGRSCGALPPPKATIASLALPFVTGEVTVEAWPIAGQ